MIKIMSMCKVSLVVTLFIILQSPTEASLLDLVPTEQSVPNIHSKLEWVLKSCFHSRLSTLVITSDLDKVVRGILEDSIVANVFLLDENFNSLQSHRNFPRWPMFLLTVNSTKTLQLTLQRLKSSAFWHADSTFFIVGVPGGGCGRVSKILWRSWQRNLLSSFYICEDVEGEVMLHMYNPFTNRAPAPWKRVETRSDGRWTLYSRLFSEGEESCKSIEFDKTEFLDGYEINAVTYLKPGATPETLSIRNLHEKIYALNADIQGTILLRMNVTVKFFLDPLMFRYEGEKSILGPKFDNMTYDYSLALFPFTSMDNETFGFTYPSVVLSITLLTHHRNFLTPAEKIANFYSFGAVSLTGLVFLITWIVLIIQRKGNMVAALEILRMALSTGMLRPFHKISIRIYLFGVFWLVLILNATFQGNMSLFLTKPTRIDVETVNDLKIHHHRVYVPKFVYKLAFEVLQNMPKSSQQVVQGGVCYNHVINDTNAACIQVTPSMLEASMKHDLHISDKPIARVYYTYPHRADWPLAKKVNTYVLRLMASGLLSHWTANAEKVPLAKLEAREAEATSPVIRPIKLVDLNFAFVILAIGLTISSLFFVVEVGGNPTKKRRPKLAIRPQQPRRRNIRINTVHDV